MCDKGYGEWQQHNGGRRWRMTPTGYIEVEGHGVPRTRGEPLTMRTMLEDYRSDLLSARELTGVDLAALMAMCVIESVRLRYREYPDGKRIASRHRDPGSIRWEKKTRARPEGEYSGGLLQVLESTASEVNKKWGFVRGGGDVHVGDLMVPRHSILLGAAYMVDRGERYDHDPLLVSVAYNAGSVRDMAVTPERPWGMRTHGEDRLDRFAAWYNDAIAVLTEEGLR